jgi:hypothetical protein
VVAGQFAARAAGAALAALALAACDSSSSEQGRRDDRPRAVDGFVAKLEREVRRLPRGRMAWSTYWRLCWARYPGARAYELETLTGEGAPSDLRRQRGRCLRLEVAADENLRSEGFKGERIQLALAASQLAYRVRARLGDGRASRWSEPYAAGEQLRPR